jgi:hypothetical protein
VTGPDARIVSGLDDLKIEMMQLNLYLRDLLAVQGRELPAPVVNVAPTPVVVQPAEPVPGVLTLDTLVQALSGALSPRAGDPVVGAINNLADEVKQSVEYSRAVAGSAYGASGGGQVHLRPEDLDALGTIIANSSSRTLTERMLAKAPQAGYSLYLDTADSTYIYIAEGPTTDTAATATAQGVRVVKDANGNPLGRVEIATAFAWNNRSAASWS